LNLFYSTILVRATNWVGDAVMSIPALEAIRARFPKAHITILARPWVADLYHGAPFCDQVLLYTPKSGAGDWKAKWRLSRILKGIGFDVAILLPNSFDSALVPFLAGIPERIGYARDARSLLLTRAVPTPVRDPYRHEKFYYLELLHRAGWIDSMPAAANVHLKAATEVTLDRPAIGLSPGAAYGTAKRWLPERFAEAAVSLARKLDCQVLVFGSKDESDVSERVASLVSAQGVEARSLAGKTSLSEFTSYASRCKVFLTNDNGAMHIASALGVPTVAVFGATNHITTGPAGEHSVVVRQKVDCSPHPHPCLLRECPIDHRCMAAVSAERVVEEALRVMAAPARPTNG
jgi:heptosyltransferase II